MKKLVNAVMSLFVLAVVAAAPLYPDYVLNPNPGATDTRGPQVPENMGSW